jgi:hypothetical protein
MNIFELFEANSPRIVVIYPGRFQPFHQGHAGVFAKLQARFGRENCYIATTPKVKIDNRNPFNAAEKVELMHSAGIPNDRIKLITEPYKIKDVSQTMGLDETNTVLIFAVGEPDKDRLEVDQVYTEFTPTGRRSKIPPGKSVGDPKPMKSLPKDLRQTVPLSQGYAYVIIVDEIAVPFEYNGQTYDISHGTECRNMWNQVRNDPDARAAFLTRLYGRATKKLVSIFNKIPYNQTEDLSPMGQSTISPISGNTNRLNAKMEDAAGVGVIANKKQKNKPQYSTSITNDVKPGAIERSLRAFRLAEEIDKLSNDISIVKESWTKKYKKSIDCDNPKGFSQRAHCAGRRARQSGRKTKSSSINESRNSSKWLKILELFLPIAMKELKITTLPSIKPAKTLKVHDHQATFGRFLNGDVKIELAIANRHPIDVLRTLAHELTHYKQFLAKELDHNSGETGSPQENEAHAIAGIIMRNFNKQYPNLIKLKSK